MACSAPVSRGSAASAADDQYSASIAMNSLAVVSEFRGQFAAALRIADDALRLADESPARQGRQYPVHIARGHILIHLDRLEEARSTLHAGRQISEERGVRWPLPSFGVYLGFERFIAGQWRVAEHARRPVHTLRVASGQLTDPSRSLGGGGHCRICRCAQSQRDRRGALRHPCGSGGYPAPIPMELPRWRWGRSAPLKAGFHALTLSFGSGTISCSW